VVIASRKLDNCTLLAHEIEETNEAPGSLAVACHVGHWDDCWTGWSRRSTPSGAATTVS
jgi:hypothetical protein